MLKYIRFITVKHQEEQLHGGLSQLLSLLIQLLCPKIIITLIVFCCLVHAHSIEGIKMLLDLPQNTGFLPHVGLRALTLSLYIYTVYICTYIQYCYNIDTCAYLHLYIHLLLLVGVAIFIILVKSHPASLIHFNEDGYSKYFKL